MTDFVESFTTQQLIPPWIAKGSRIWAFVIRTEASCMQNYLDTHLNSPGPDQAPYHYRCIDETGYGLLMVADHPDFSSGANGIEGWDTVKHKEVFWAFPAMRYDLNKNNLLGQGEVVWIQPFYFDDSSYVMFSSREIWGSEKQLGNITLQEGKRHDQLHIDLSTQGFAKFNPRSKAKSLAVMHARLNPGTEPVDLRKIILKDSDIATFNGTIMASFNLFGAPPENTPGLRRGIEINTLKQFRDVFDMRAAAYRAIIASHVKHELVGEPQFFYGEQVELDFMWSDTMKEQLIQLFGLEEPEEGTHTVGHDDKGDAPPSGFDPDGADEEELSLEHRYGRPPMGDINADWNLPRVRVPVEYAFSFTTNARFEVLGTLHTYGTPGAA
ncbi:hypothetical protein [Altererythrobacter sp.]|uniref:hypothetical protein n=1 Tax=Altererythrobacter sp. TaxID=1872480 RepID=UPI003CFE2DF0